jgi:large subunit ribosomal protein L13
MNHTSYKIDPKAKSWYFFDAQDQILGRLCSQVAKLLIGKHKPNYTPLFDSGDYVVIINAGKIKLSGVKEEQKVYHRYTGYLGNLKTQSFKELKARKPEWVIHNAIRQMLPKNRLSTTMLKKLRIYAGAEHPHQGVNFINQ